MAEKETIICEMHGKQETTFVCQHLAKSLRTKETVGYFCSTESPDNPRPALQPPQGSTRRFALPGCVISQVGTGKSISCAIIFNQTKKVRWKESH